MAQIFRPTHNVLGRLGVLGAAVTPLALMVTFSQFSRSGWATGVGVPYEQPVAFSHEHHVTELGIDCRYCHTGVEVGAKAGYPSTHTCMSCHSQVWSNSPLLEPIRESYVKNVPLKWTKLNAVPDFVFFNHSIHVKRGLNCNNCHGPVQAMQMAFKGRPFQMRWCLECHRAPEKYINEPQVVFDMYKQIQRGNHLKDADKVAKEVPLSLPIGGTKEIQSLASGEQYHRNKEELAKGLELVKKYHIKKEQLSDCATCHH
jgi:hypothetical protein